MNNTQLVLPHIAGRIFGTPLMIAPQKLDAVLAMMMPRLLSSDLSVAALAGEAKEEASPSITETGIAVIPLFGITVRRAGFLDAMCGMVSYESIKASIEAAVTNPRVRGILLDCDTPGGEVAGLFDLVQEIGALRASIDKPIWAIADELAASAGYAIASVADRILITQTGQVGSIGVVTTHIDQSALDKQEGLSYTFIYAGDHKIDGNAHMPLPTGVKENLQADIDKLYGKFVSLVAANRGIKSSAVIDTQAAIYRGQDAVAIKLADAVQTFDETIAEFSEFLSRPAIAGARRGAATQITHPEIGEQMAGNQMAAEIEAAQITNTPIITGDLQAQKLAEAERERSAEIMAIVDQAKTLGVDVDGLTAIRNGTSPAVLQTEVLRRAAEKSTASHIVAASVTQVTSGSVSAAPWDKAFAKAAGIVS